MRDEFSADEHAAWIAFFAAFDVQEAGRKAQAEHDAVMKATADALAKGT